MDNTISLTSRIQAFIKLSELLKRISATLDGNNGLKPNGAAEKAICVAGREAEKTNPWFTQREIARALNAISVMTSEKALLKWAKKYPGMQGQSSGQKTVAVIMAGNIPLVGFHDFLCVLIAGHRFLGKLSSQDAQLPVALADLLLDIEPGLKSQVAFTKELAWEADAIIATGSDNTARYFEYHFGNKPHIIRKNRNSVAVLTGEETEEELQMLGEDIFAYYGLGCRSVSHLFVPEDLNLHCLAEAWKPFKYLLLNKKYKNNLDYNKALSEVSGTSFSHAGHCIFAHNPALASPLSVIHYTPYKSITEAEKFIQIHATGIQCVVSGNKLETNAVPVVSFGQSQQPELDDYADGVDTMQFLLSLD